MKKYKNTFKELLSKGSGVFIASKGIYGNQEEKRLKKLNEHEFDFDGKDYFSEFFLNHLIQPYLKAKYGAYLSKEMIQESKDRYAIKIANTEIDLIFIMQRNQIELILVDPCLYTGGYSSRVASKEILIELKSFYIFYKTCTNLDCLSIERYWDFIKTLAIRYGFYPKRIFHEESCYIPKDIDLYKIEPKFCLYSGEPLEEGFFKDSKASSDFFNPRYSENGLFGKKVLLYSDTLESKLESKLNEKYKTMEKDFEEEVQGWSKEDRENRAGDYGWDDIELEINPNTITDLSSDCAKEIAKKINSIKHKHSNTKQKSNLIAFDSIKSLLEYLSPNKHQTHIDIIDTLLLIPKMNARTFKTISTAKDGRLESLINKLATMKSEYCTNNKISEKEFYIELNKQDTRSYEEFKIKDIKKLIELECNPLNYPKAFTLVGYENHSTDLKKYRIKIDSDNFLFEILNFFLQLVRSDSKSNTSNQRRPRLIPNQIFRFYKNIIESKINFNINKRIKQS
jgi:hypothetical protein